MLSAANVIVPSMTNSQLTQPALRMNLAINAASTAITRISQRMSGPTMPYLWWDTCKWTLWSSKCCSKGKQKKNQHHDPAGSTTSDALMLSVQQEFSTKLIENMLLWLIPTYTTLLWLLGLTGLKASHHSSSGQLPSPRISNCYDRFQLQKLPCKNKKKWSLWPMWGQTDFSHITHSSANKNSIKMIGTIILWFKDSSKCRQNLKRIVYVTGNADKLSLSQESFTAQLGRISLHFPTMDEAPHLTPATKPDKVSEATGKTNSCTITSTWECTEFALVATAQTNSTTYTIPSNQG